MISQFRSSAYRGALESPKVCKSVSKWSKNQSSSHVRKIPWTKSKKTTRINAQLNKKYVGFLDLKVFPENAIITIDNNRRIYKNSYDLAPGKHKIIIDATFYKKESKSLKIYNEENLSLDIKLVQKDPKKARRLAWMFPGIGHIYSDNNKKGLILSVLGITGVLSTYVMYSEFSKY